jgi:hypothetical protein
MSMFRRQYVLSFLSFSISLKRERDSEGGVPKGRDVEVMTRPASGCDLIAIRCKIMMPQLVTRY